MSLKLTNAYAQTVRDEDDNGWVIYDGEGNRLWVLPQPCNERTAIEAIKFAREYEKAAVIRMGGSEINLLRVKTLQEENAQLKLAVQQFRNENERLSEALERAIQ